MKTLGNKKKLITAFLLLLILVFTISFYSNQNKNFKGYKKNKVLFKNKTYTLFIADTEEKRSKGLSDIPSIKSNEGMLFTFEKPDYYFFWMKDMKFPLDFIFINQNKVVNIFENISPSPYLNSFTSSEKADKVIELNSGEIKKSPIQKGDTVSFTTIN